MKKRKNWFSRIKRFYPHTSFSQLTLAFLVFGVLPLLILTVFFSVHYARSIRSVMVKNYSQIDHTLSRSIEEIIENSDQAMGSVYEFTASDGCTLNEVLTNNDLTEEDREDEVNDILTKILNDSKYFSSVRMTTEDGHKYAVFDRAEKKLKDDESAEEFFVFDPFTEEKDPQSLLIMPAAAESAYCENSEDYCFDLVRNVYSVEDRDDPIVTLYCGIDVDVITDLLEKENLGSDLSVSIYDIVGNGYIYSSEEEQYVKEPDTPSYYHAYLTEKSGNQSIGDKWLFYDRLEGTDCYVITLLEQSALLGVYQRNILTILAVIAIVIFVLVSSYMMFSRRMSSPHVRLKQAMEQIQMGNLDARVDVVATGDEMEYLCEGFNKMAEDLQKNIEQSLVSQIFARQAELDALKMQIQPHYLYNTLDVIRMTALNQDDEVTADLLEALATQLHYVVGYHDDHVTLHEELEMLQTYFVINKVRYDNQFQLSIHVSEEDQNLYILKMMLQPIVENAIKHGLRPKNGPGVVSVSVHRREQMLEIVVMDDGVGMTEEQLTRIREVLDKKEIGYKDETGWVSVGMKNVYDRIHIDCGAEYGFTIESMVGAGTVVTFHLPVWEGENQNEKSDSR